VQQQTNSTTYWTDDFRITQADLDSIYSLFLEEERPFTNEELALHVIKRRLHDESEKMRKLVERGKVYQPKERYPVGAELIFPAQDFAVGRVVADRPGDNPEYGEFSVIKVEFEDKKQAEFASGLAVGHKLNLDMNGGSAMPEGSQPDPQEIYAAHHENIIETLEARLVDEDDAIYFGGRWFLKSLLLDVNIGNLHLAEALLDMAGGGPLTTSELLKDLELPKKSTEGLREFSLEVALSGDERFDEVGPIGHIWWYLKRLEPPEVFKIPDRLAFEPFPYPEDQVRGELKEIEIELDDEFSNLPPPEGRLDEAHLVLIYPHRRMGTLPLTSRVQQLFPTASEARRIRMTFIDAQAENEEFAAWVVRDARCVIGLGEYYRKHRLPIGASLTIRRTDDPTRLIIDFEGHKARTEYIRLAQPKDHKLTFANFKRSIGAGYDELMILGAEDIEGVDAIWNQVHRNKRISIVDIMRDLIPELAKLTPQDAVHAKTLYSAVNILRRCPPGPIFAMLVSRPEFDNVAGPYWRLSG
jgi:hypothetical protein